MDKKELSSQANNLKPIIQIGKSGLSDSIKEEIKKHLKKRKLIKIKCLSYFLDSFEDGLTRKEKMKEIAQQISEQFGAELIQIRGFTFTIYYGH